MLYIGTLDHRNIYQTILGLSRYLKTEGSLKGITYDIVGFGKPDVIAEIIQTIESEKLEKQVFYYGRKKIDELLPFFESSNLGIVYIPQTEAYDCQPVTKLFEYLLAGMPVIATNTLENRIIMRPEFGEVTEDNPEGFADSLSKIVSDRRKYNSERIKNKCLEYQWSSIVSDILDPYFDEILSKSSGKYNINPNSE